MIRHAKSRLLAQVPVAAAAALLSLAAPATAHVVSTVGLTIVTAPTTTVGSNFLINAGLPPQLIFDERQGVILGADLNTDTGVITKGTKVDSQFFALNSRQDAVVDTSATFDGLVLGIVYWSGSGNYSPSDFLGAPGASYNEAGCGNCGFESGPDSLSIAGNKVTFHNDYDEPGDFARVITAAASGTPEPAAWALMLSGFTAIGAMLRRRRAGEAAALRA